MANRIEPGDVRVGYISDGMEGIPAQAGTLTFDERRGTELSVPYLWERQNDPRPQFAHTASWFNIEGESMPRTIVFADNLGVVTLTDNRFGFASLGTQPLGRVNPQAVIFGQPRTFQHEYLVRDFKSTIDGLDEFTRFSSITFDSDRSGDAYRTTVVIEPAESVQWESGGLEFRIRANVAWSGVPGRSFDILDRQPYVQTTSRDGLSLRDHLSAQWSIRALLILALGKKLAWRSHQLRDDEFPTWMLSGKANPAAFIDVHLAGTVEQQSWPPFEPGADPYPPFQLSHLGSEGMRKWVQCYSEETFERAVQPAVEVFNGATKFLEPQLMMLAISLDRFGYYRYGDHRRRDMWEHIQRCLNDAGLDWPQIGSRRAIARAIARMNNDLKHPDRERYPEGDELAGVVQLSKVIVRAQVIDLLGLDDTVRENLLVSNDARNAVDIFTRHGLSVNEEGLIVRAARTDR